MPMLNTLDALEVFVVILLPQQHLCPELCQLLLCTPESLLTGDQQGLQLCNGRQVLRAGLTGQPAGVERRQLGRQSGLSLLCCSCQVGLVLLGA